MSERINERINERMNERMNAARRLIVLPTKQNIESELKWKT